MILNQWQRPNCWIFAVMAILQHKGIPFDMNIIQEERSNFVNLIERIFKWHGLIKRFNILKTPTVMDIQLKKWEWILCSTARGNFKTKDVTFDWDSNHFFVIVADLGDKWKIQNSWGEEWGDKWYWYMDKKDFKYMMAPRTVIC